MRSVPLARSVRGVAICTCLCALALCLAAPSAPGGGEAPGNDNFLFAFPINSPGTRLTSFKDVRDTAGASLQSNIFAPCQSSKCPSGPQETSTCNGVPYGKTIWYGFYPDHNGQVEISTAGIPNVITLYKYDPQTGELDDLQCAKGSRYKVNELHAYVQRGLDYMYQIGGRNREGNLLSMQFTFAYNRFLALPLFFTRDVIESIGGARPKLLKLRFIGATERQSVTVACATCGGATFRTEAKHGYVVVLRATPPPTITSRTRVLVAATSPAQIGRFKLYGYSNPYRPTLIDAGCLEPGVASVSDASVNQLSLLPQVSCPNKVTRARGGEYVFWEDTAGHLWEKRFTAGAWTPKRELSASKLGSGPGVAVHANGEQDVFWKGRAGSLWETWYTSRWHRPAPYGGGPLASAPAAGVDAAGDEYVFWQGTDMGLWEKTFSGGEWGSAVPLNAGRLGAGPAVAVHANGETDVFWKGANGNLWEMTYTGGWNRPQDLQGGELGSAPTAGVDAAGNQYVFWRGTDGGLWEMRCANGSCVPASEVPSAGRIGSAPSVAVHANGQQDVFYRGLNGRLWETWYTTKWNGPRDLGGGQLNANAAPSAGVYDTSQQPPA